MNNLSPEEEQKQFDDVLAESLRSLQDDDRDRADFEAAIVASMQEHKREQEQREQTLEERRIEWAIDGLGAATVYACKMSTIMCHYEQHASEVPAGIRADHKRACDEQDAAFEKCAKLTSHASALEVVTTAYSSVTEAQRAVWRTDPIVNQSLNLYIEWEASHTA
jgi:hypothetical protein